MKTKSDCHKVYNYQNALCDLILVEFNKEIKYDYSIPPPLDVLHIASDSLDQWKTNCQLKKDILEIVEKDENDYNDAFLRRHLWDETVFGHEWFYGLGDFFRYRKEKRAEAINKTYDHPSLSDSKMVYEPNIQHRSLKKEVLEFIEILNENIEKFYEKWEKEKR